MTAKCSPTTTNIDKQLLIISDAIKVAQDKIDSDAANSPEIIRAISTVESFLRKSDRLCYGGRAIDAHMPPSAKLYNSKRTIPDYDFFTPNMERDADELVENLRKKGFIDIAVREGMHEGTMKLYVNFVSVADMTKLDPDIYNVLHKRRYTDDRISYIDANMIRMMSYLELSRPKGEVSRWPKVYERLMLLNKFAPMKRCTKRQGSLTKRLLTTEEVRTTMNYILHENRIFAGADLVGLYSNYLRKKQRAGWIMRTAMPIYFYSPDIEKDRRFFKNEYDSTGKISVSDINLSGDMIPFISVFQRNGSPILIIVSQTACHSFYNIPLKQGQTLQAASLDTLITLYFSLSLLNKKFIELTPLECLAQELIEISCRARSAPSDFPFPFISLTCSGHQSGKPSLIRKKVKRIKTEKIRQYLKRLEMLE